MQQIIPGETRAIGVTLDLDVISKIKRTRQQIEVRSLLVWEEHCTECAMPACFSSCAFYSPRSDLKCRRFKRGLVRVFAADDPSIVGMSLCFRKWAKLEARGSAYPVSAHHHKLVSLADGAIYAALGMLPAIRRLPYALARRWENLKMSLPKWKRANKTGEAFVLECLLLGAPSQETLTISVMPKTPRKSYFQKAVKLLPGYNKVVIDYKEIAALVDLSQEPLFQIEPIGDWTGRELLITLADFVIHKPGALQIDATPLASTSNPNKKVKCLVWDLDNTLWRGTLTEDGLDGLELNQEAAHVIREIDKKGILNSIASKNNAEDAFEALKKFGLSEYFLAPQISWGPKSEALKVIASKLNIGVDALAFIDDQPFERAEVQTAHPGVCIFSERDIVGLLALPEFVVPTT